MRVDLYVLLGELLYIHTVTTGLEWNMYTSGYANAPNSLSSTKNVAPRWGVSTGFISEVVYREDQPLLTQLPLLPLLQQFGQ